MKSNANNGNSNGKHDGIDLPRAASIMLEHKWLITSITLAFIILGACYALIATPVYRADALVQIEQASRSNPLADVTTLLGKEPPSQAEIEIIRSRMVLGRTVDQLHLDILLEPAKVPVLGGFLDRLGIERPAFASDWHYAWSGESLQLTDMDVTQGLLKKTFTLEVIDSNRYSLSLDDELVGEGNSDGFSEFLDGRVRLLIENIQAPPGTQFHLTRVPRLLAISKLGKSLSIKEKGQETGILNWSLLGPDPESAERILRTIGEIYVDQNIQHRSEEARRSLEFLEEQLPKVRAELASAEDQLNAYRIDRESVDLSLETRAVLERLVNLELQLNELELTEAEISRRFTPTHPTYAALLDKKLQLQKERVGIEDKIESLPETQQQILRLQRDASVNQQIYVQLRNKVQEMQIAEASTVGNVRVLDRAEGFPRPVKPNKKMILVYAAIFGVMVSVCIVMLLGLRKSGIQSQEEIEDLGLPVFATVPLCKSQMDINKKRKRASANQSQLLALVNPADTAIEALRALRTSLYFKLNDSNSKCLMISSASPSAGKSFISANLAAICAQAGQRVLLIDADMRRGSTHKFFSDQSEDGLSEVLSGKPLKGAIREVETIENLHYIARGVVPPNPAELLAKSRFAKILQIVEDEYDLVIIDSPPVLAVTDAAVIGSLVGTSLLVARYKRNSIKEIELALHRLQQAGVTVSGSILNALEESAALAYGYGNYTYSYKPTT